MSVGVVILEVSLLCHFISKGVYMLTMRAKQIPSNLILYKLGPTIWIGGQVFAWLVYTTSREAKCPKLWDLVD